MIHRLPVTIGGVHTEVGSCVGQPACAGAFPLDRVGAEEAAHLVLMRLRIRMRLSMRGCVLVITMSLGIGLDRMLVSTVGSRSGGSVFVRALLFFFRCGLFHTGRCIFAGCIACLFLTALSVAFFLF